MPATTLAKNERLLEVILKVQKNEDLLSFVEILKKTDNERCADKIEGIDNLTQKQEDSFQRLRRQTFASTLAQQLDLSTYQNGGVIQKLWNVPPKNPNFIGRGELLEQVEGFLNEGGCPTIITACHGIGGVGKTQIALEFVWRHNENYSGVLWFNAESQYTLERDYIQLGNTLNLFRGNGNAKHEVKVDIVKHWLENPAQRGCLLVYDNAPKCGSDGIQKYIPATGSKVIITSRYAFGWSKSFTVDVFTREESKMFLEKILFDMISEGEKNSIAELLGDLPLGLAQAAAYMKATRMEAPRYLKLYKTRKENVLQDEILSQSEGTLAADSKRAIVFITWDITMEAIHKESLLAENWLNSCAYLAATNIPDYLLEAFAKDAENNPKEEIYEQARGILNSYSMLALNCENKTASIHRLVQEVIQLKRKREGFGIVVKNGFTLRSSFPLEEYSMASRATRRDLVPHLEMCLEHLNSYAVKKDVDLLIRDTLVTLSESYLDLRETKKTVNALTRALEIEEKYFESDHIGTASTLTGLGNAYGDLGEAGKKRDLLERALTIQEKHYKSDKTDQLMIDISVTLTNLGNAYGDLGDAAKFRDLLERALEITEKYYGPDQVEVAITLGCLGNAYGDLGDATKQRDLLERALAMTERHCGPHHVQLVAQLGYLGNAYGALGDAGEKRDLLERALAIEEKYYGPDHVQLAVVLTNLGIVNGDLGDNAKQRDLLERTLSIQQDYFGPDHINVAKTLTNLGYAYGLLGQTEKQRNVLERALPILENFHGGNHIKVLAQTLKALAEVYGTLGLADRQAEVELTFLTLMILFTSLNH